jgi:hypothetical protein
LRSLDQELTYGANARTCSRRAYRRRIRSAFADYCGAAFCVGLTSGFVTLDVAAGETVVGNPARVLGPPLGGRRG